MLVINKIIIVKDIFNDIIYLCIIALNPSKLKIIQTYQEI